MIFFPDWTRPICTLYLTEEVSQKGMKKQFLCGMIGNCHVSMTMQKYKPTTSEDHPTQYMQYQKQAWED